MIEAASLVDTALDHAAKARMAAQGEESTRNALVSISMSLAYLAAEMRKDAEEEDARKARPTLCFRCSIKETCTNCGEEA